MTLNRLQCDVAIVGGGVAGLIAAVRVAQGGLHAIVLEKLSEDRYVCNSRLTAGVWHCCATDILDDPETLYAKVMESTNGIAQPDLARAVTQDGLRTVRWMQSVGVRFMKGPFNYQSYVLAPPSVTPQGCDWRGRGGDVMLRAFETQLQHLGGSVQRGHRATTLEYANGRITGLSGETAGGDTFHIQARAVVIADGGFQSNPGMIAQAITSAPERVFQRNAGTGMGDGLRMAQQAGAGATDLSGFYGHVLSRDAYTNDKLWPYPYLDYIVTAGIVVNGNAERFTDEGLGGVAVANAIAATPDPLEHIVIADTPIWQECGVVRMISPNPLLDKLGATIHRADSLADLARRCGLDAARLGAVVGEYNDAVRTGSTLRLTPARTTARYLARPVATPPFLAFPVCAGITYTMGGISINADGCVLDTTGGIALDGLYAAGCTTGGLEGGAKGGYVGGLLKSSVIALRAAERILKVSPSL
jgi:fumarate reductase flavoprotein subunit